MNTKLMKLYKEYTQPFLLEPTKLRRIVDEIHECFDNLDDSSLHDTFEIFFTGSRREEMNSVEEVLALDNSRKHKIERLLILCSASASGAVRPEHEVQVDFAGPKAPSNTATSSHTKVVSISVRGNAAGWTSRTLSEVEEQVERTWLRHSRPLVALVGILLVALLVLASQFVSIRPIPWRYSDTWWLSNADLDRIETMLKEHSTLTDEELREVETRQYRNILDFQRPQNSTQVFQPKRALFLGITSLGIIVCVLILLTCYPGAVFAWGDEQEHYANILQRRKTVWGIIVAVTLVGVLSRFFFEGLSFWFPQKP